jgi:outer membrane protein TolC
MRQTITGIYLKNTAVNVCFKILILVFIFWAFRLPAGAQDLKDFDVSNYNIENILPPLETIIDSAITNNPLVRFREMDIKVNEHKLRTDQVVWTKDLGIQTDVRYGTFNNFSTNTSEGQSPSTLASLSSQLNYGFGAYLKVPIYDIINRKNQINQSKAEIEKAISMAEAQRNDVRQLIIRQYNEVILKQRLLKNKLRYIETARINMQMTEKEFLNGVIPTGEYTRISEIISRAESDLENSRVDFITAFMMLEELAGCKFKINTTTDEAN